MLFNGIVLLKELSNQLSVFFSLDFELIRLLLDFNYLFSLSIEHLLHFLHCSFEFGLLLLAFLEFPLDSMN